MSLASVLEVHLGTSSSFGLLLPPSQNLSPSKNLYSCCFYLSPSIAEDHAPAEPTPFGQSVMLLLKLFVLRLAAPGATGTIFCGQPVQLLLKLFVIRCSTNSYSFLPRLQGPCARGTDSLRTIGNVIVETLRPTARCSRSHRHNLLRTTGTAIVETLRHSVQYKFVQLPPSSSGTMRPRNRLPSDNRVLHLTRQGCAGED